MQVPLDLERFVQAQDGVYDAVLAELLRGKKRGHWMWFVFPQLRGLGQSATSQRYGITSAAEARSYLEHPVLGSRLRECTTAVNLIIGRSAHEIFGWPDDLKFHSSMTLFGLVGPDVPVFGEALDKYFAGRNDERSVELLNEWGDE
jgi:uncharacterized protein (DUF1810 family)